MEPQSTQSADGEKPGLISSLAGAGRNLLGLVLNRMELAMLELSELSVNAAKLLLIVALALTALWFSIAFFTVLAVYLLWQYWGWVSLLAFGGLFAVITAVLGWVAWKYLRDGKLAMPMTISELRQDRNTLL
jgi:uncharacterized membrane protein YqjE